MTSPSKTGDELAPVLHSLESPSQHVDPIRVGEDPELLLSNCVDDSLRDARWAVAFPDDLGSKGTKSIGSSSPEFSGVADIGCYVK
jgi:hypothetical protein